MSGVHERRALKCTTSGAPAKRSRSRKRQRRNRSIEKVTARRSRFQAKGAAMRLR